ncbi:phospholipid-translocating P-type ATPase, flippase family protein (macronuclear) [Tetrahymena thermophila SB210]|uniref:Phospholipid-transporting ATPase n=1 Tax=Tetrahymena thermophila (strain SB210) TaxID=312017 RepID=Q23VA5_TETTS|nr:phospholipid-translocating P-type ATPase, flippase family protein [Tetrahymena thermophila SB210]EAS00453.2 phospholipid-translocating P-type ATPase, flippase family protein [Tetrahymena thermophila SB210]|eukprot:XP_001020698.2 phospholipid-translocating P-type ATPase, flippase family protein [Tetrahymena thermophila SB210]
MQIYQVDKVNKIQNSYENAIEKPYLYCFKKKVARKQELRSVYAGIPDNQVCNNRIQTSKYNYLTFIPKNLLVQFSKLANIYFIIIGICQIIPQITTTDGKPLVYTPLGIIIFISMVKDFIEDRKRRKQDEYENKSLTNRFNASSGEFEKVAWEELTIGDIIKVDLNERFPADILILSTTNQYGNCYVETKNLDGETNLKLRQSCASLIFTDENAVKNVNNIGRFQFQYEDPNYRIHSFNGIMMDEQEKDPSKSKYPLSLQNICLRGCTLKRTHSITAVVIYSGHDCKSLKYAQRGHYKFGTVEKMMNKMVFYIFLILILISIFCAAYYVIWYSYKKDELTYLHIGEHDIESYPAGDFFLRIPMWVLLLSNFVPISLLVTLEIVKYLQGQLLTRDKNFVNKLSDELVEVNSSNLIDQLGQVRYILTDKTGTLTGNVMKFKALSVNSNSYEHTAYDDNGILNSTKLLEQLKDSSENQLEYEALLCMNLCHELMIEFVDGKKLYLGTSPDEECIMEFCLNTGIYLDSIDEHKVMTIIDSINGRTIQFKLIAIHEYRSELRKMSVLVQNLQTKQYKIYQKGAMNTIFDICSEDQSFKKVKVEEHLNDYANNMLRTLCLSYKNLTEKEVSDFLQKKNEELSKGNLNIQDINDQVFSLIEKNHILIGGTGVNDEFADQVVSTLANLKKAGIKIWMITGDKKETALSIGIKSNIVEKDGDLQVIEEGVENGQNDNFTIEQLKKYKKQLQDQKKLSIGISGLTYHNIHISQNAELIENFNFVMKNADSVIAFHFTPIQKKQLVDLVHQISPGQCVLSIGDGANDINMIQAANVGIGIRGKEGREAAKASDFSLAEFKHLNRLLLYTGQEAYRKNSYLIFFNFYKNQAWNLVYFWFNFYAGQSAQYVYDQWMTQFFNLFYVSLPIILYALFDEMHPSNEFFQPIQTRKNVLESRPQDYKHLTNNLIFQQKNFWSWFFYGSLHSLIIMFLSFLSVGEFSDKNGKQTNLFYQGMLAYTCCVILGNLKVQQLHRTHHFVTLFFIYGSIGFYFMNLYIANKITTLDCYGVINGLFRQANTYFAIMIMIMITYGIDSAYEIFNKSRNNADQQQNTQFSLQMQVYQGQKENNIIVYDKSSQQGSDQNCIEEKAKKDYDSSSAGDINKNLLIYPLKVQIKDNILHDNLAGSNYQLEEDQPYDNEVSNKNKKKQVLSQAPLQNKQASPSLLIQKADKK